MFSSVRVHQEVDLTHDRAFGIVSRCSWFPVSDLRLVPGHIVRPVSPVVASVLRLLPNCILSGILLTRLLPTWAIPHMHAFSSLVQQVGRNRRYLVSRKKLRSRGMGARGLFIIRCIIGATLYNDHIERLLLLCAFRIRFPIGGARRWGGSRG